MLRGAEQGLGPLQTDKPTVRVSLRDELLTVRTQYPCLERVLHSSWPPLLVETLGHSLEPCAGPLGLARAKTARRLGRLVEQQHRSLKTPRLDTLHHALCEHGRTTPAHRGVAMQNPRRPIPSRHACVLCPHRQLHKLLSSPRRSIFRQDPASQLEQLRQHHLRYAAPFLSRQPTAMFLGSQGGAHESAEQQRVPSLLWLPMNLPNPVPAESLDRHSGGSHCVREHLRHLLRKRSLKQQRGPCQLFLGRREKRQ